MSHGSSRGKEIAIDVPSSPISKQTRRSSQDSNSEKFKTPLDSQTHSSIFQKAPTVVERVVKFDTLGTKFIPRIFEAKDWVDLFGNFEDPIDELVKEFYSNARYTGVELKCWVRGKEFTINPDYIPKVLRITRPADVDLTPYDDKQSQIQYTLQVRGPDHEVSSKGTSIGTTKFAPELNTLKLIMFFNLYPFSNTTFINLGRAQFLCDLITGAPIDICAHIFQIIGKTTAQSVALTCIPFCSLVMKIMVLEGVSTPEDRKKVDRLRPLSMISLQVSKSHSSKAPKSEPFLRATSSSQGSATPVHTEIASPVPSKMQTTSTPSAPSSSQADGLSNLIESVSQRISGLERLLYSTNNQVQVRLTTIET